MLDDQAAEADADEDERPAAPRGPAVLEGEQQVVGVLVDRQGGGGVVAPEDDARVGHVEREEVARPADGVFGRLGGEAVAAVAVYEDVVSDDGAFGEVDDCGAVISGLGCGSHGWVCRFRLLGE